MSPFPVLPNTLVTRQLECISCKELFTVSEDIMEGRETPTAEWQASADAVPITNLRFHPTRNQRQIMPEGRAEPQQIPQQAGSHNNLYHVNCPRCSADNRNWLKIANKKIFGDWRRKAIALGTLISIIIAVVVFRQPVRPDISEVSRWTMIVITFWAGVIPVFLLTSQWRQQREYGYIRKFIYSFTAKKEVAPSVKRAAMLFLAFTVAFPLVFFVFSPWGFFTISNLLLKEETPSRIERLDDITEKLPARLAQDGQQASDKELVFNALVGLKGLALAQNNQCTSVKIASMINQLEALPIDNLLVDKAGSVKTAVSDLQLLQQQNQPACQTDLIENVLTDLRLLQVADEICVSTDGEVVCDYQERLEALIAEVEGLKESAFFPERVEIAPSIDNPVWVSSVLADIRNLAIGTIGNDVRTTMESNFVTIEEYISPPKDGWFPVDIEYLIEWGFFVGGAALVGVMVGSTAVNDHVRKINRHLPRPLFSSVANMTRVVLWEANRALEIGGLIHHIEWTNVQRNDSGGIDLHGIYRAPSDDENSSRVRAKIYEIRSNKWGRIEKAFISDRLVPVPPPEPVDENVESVISAGRVRV